ncbi:hypothetical protein L596_007416 [Steinernema carpocapsae]|uniref:Uncharacterized protein n=1 Tax=Steinernema carpocapsae TaxID=34508 RepID=A0A4U5P975_STECR|nr:hypothetical protein L596_007416 [Steinernema carpocapsae]
MPAEMEHGLRGDCEASRNPGDSGERLLSPAAEDGPNCGGRQREGKRREDTESLKRWSPPSSEPAGSPLAADPRFSAASDYHNRSWLVVADAVITLLFPQKQHTIYVGLAERFANSAPTFFRESSTKSSARVKCALREMASAPNGFFRST